MPTQIIQQQECIGDSLVKINNNFGNLDRDVASLSSISFRANNVTTVASRSIPTTTTRVLSVYNGPTYVGYIPLF
jgi:hypothetical protein